MQDYRRLRVWKHANDLAVGTRKTTRTFPRTGYRELRDQIIRAAESIPFNIAEGCGAATQKEFARYLDIAIKSSCELESQLKLAKDYEILREKDWNALADDTVDARRMLCGLRKKVLAPLDNPLRCPSHGEKTVNGKR